MPTFTTQTTLACAPDAVFALIVDLSKWPMFRGAGPVPGIVSAEATDGAPLAKGSRVRVTNTDGSVHHEVVVDFVHAQRYHVAMEVRPPASRVLAGIEERVELAPGPGGGTEMTRTFVLTPASRLASPIASMVSWFLARAVRKHDEAVRVALGG